MFFKNNTFYFVKDQLFDLVNDPRETTNKFISNSKKSKELKKLLKKSLQSVPNRPYGEFVKNKN
mgnify:CR=1 FL=1